MGKFLGVNIIQGQQFFDRVKFDGKSTFFRVNIFWGSKLLGVSKNKVSNILEFKIFGGFYNVFSNGFANRFFNGISKGFLNGFNKIFMTKIFPKNIPEQNFRNIYVSEKEKKTFEQNLNNKTHKSAIFFLAWRQSQRKATQHFFFYGFK